MIDQRRHGAGDDRSEARCGDQMPARRVVTAGCHQLSVDHLELLLDAAQRSTSFSSPSRNAQGMHRSSGSTRIDTNSAIRAGPAATTIPNSAIRPRSWLHQHDALLHQQIAHPMDAGRCLLLLGLDRRQSASMAGSPLRRSPSHPPHRSCSAAHRPWRRPVGSAARHGRACATRGPSSASVAHASMPTRQHGSLANNARTCARRSDRRITTAPSPSMPAPGRPVLRQVQTDRANLLHGWLPFVGVVNTQLWHTDAVRGPSTPSWPGLSRPSVPHGCRTDGRDKPGHDGGRYVS